MELPLSPALIALLPPVLHGLEWLSDRFGWLGGKLIRKRLPLDHRAVIKDTFVSAPNSAAVLDAIETYFQYEEAASDLIKLHLSFALSLYFAGVEESHDLFSLKGWPLFGLAIVAISFVAFLYRLAQNKPSAAAVRPFRWWNLWVWILFVAILVYEVGGHLPGAPAPGAAPAPP